MHTYKTRKDVGTTLSDSLWRVSGAPVIFLLSQGESLSFNLSDLRSGGTEVMTLPGMGAGRRSLCQQR